MRFHFSFHKCLTKYSSLVFHRALNNTSLSLKDTRFNSLKDYHVNSELQMAPIIIFLLRQSRELIVWRQQLLVVYSRPERSAGFGYYYHRKGIEPWTRIQNPSSADYDIVNGCVECLKKSGLSMHHIWERCDIAEAF